MSHELKNAHTFFIAAISCCPLRVHALGDMMSSSVTGRHSQKVSSLLNSPYTTTKVPTFENFQALGDKMISSTIGKHSEKVSSLLNSPYTMTGVLTFENFQALCDNMRLSIIGGHSQKVSSPP